MISTDRLENPRYELIGGREWMLAQSVTSHAGIARNLSVIIGGYLRGKRCRLFAEVDVFFDEENQYIPDLIIVCDKDKIKERGIYGAPDLVVEILSPSTAARDRTVKMEVYEKFGVREYWIIEPKSKSVEVYHLINGKFKLDHVYHPYEDWEWDMLTEKEKSEQRLSLKVSLYSDLDIDIKEIFED